MIELGRQFAVSLGRDDVLDPFRQSRVMTVDLERRESKDQLRRKRATAHRLDHVQRVAEVHAVEELELVLDLAKRPNEVIKVSGACTLSQQPYPFPDIWDPLARVFDAWGFDRCLWGTDWTRAFAVVNYEQAVEPFRLTDRLSDSERAMLMGGACAKAYGWSPKQG